MARERARRLPGWSTTGPGIPQNTARFESLAVTHALMIAADAVMLVALASTVLALDANAARTQVLLYQLTTLAPFTVVAPFIGPMIDRARGGRRFMVELAAFGRIVVSIGLVITLNSLWLYPVALAAMVLKQTYSVSKSALVPLVATTEADLMEANAKLGVVAGIAAVVAASVAAVLQHFSPRATLVLSAILFLVAFVSATKLPREAVARSRAGTREVQELRNPTVLVGASAIGLLRAAVGFMQFLLYFWLRSQGAGKWFGAAIAVGAVCTMLGNLAGPRLRRLMKEETMLISGLAVVSLSGVLCALAGGKSASVALMGTVNFGAAIGKLAFDSIVQRDAHDANQGRAFARFESRFQLAWVLAAIPPVIWTPPGEVGFVIVSLIAGFAAATYLIGMRAVRLGQPVPESMSKRAGRTIVKKIDELRTPSGGMSRPEQSGTPSAGLQRRQKYLPAAERRASRRAGRDRGGRATGPARQPRPE
jgi:hypothetical protein